MLISAGQKGLMQKEFVCQNAEVGLASNGKSALRFRQGMPGSILKEKRQNVGYPTDGPVAAVNVNVFTNGNFSSTGGGLT
jgi:hypothetical protein